MDGSQAAVARRIRAGRTHNVLDRSLGPLGEVAIYTLSDPRDVQQVRYVGQTRAPPSRFTQHMRAARLWLPDDLPWWIRRDEMRPLYSWIRQLYREESRLPVMLVVAWTEAHNARLMERTQIDAYLAAQLPLLNFEASLKPSLRRKAKATSISKPYPLFATGFRGYTDAMKASKISFTATLHKPAEAGKGEAWTFLLLPKAASAKLPTRGQTVIEGTINGAAFHAAVDPDGQKSHWLKVPKKLRLAAGAIAGDEVKLEIAPSTKELEPELPAELRKALAASPEAKAVWADITPAARRDWIYWISTAKQEATRLRRIDNACDMLAEGKRRVCCFDRSGYFSKSLCAPKAADQD
jgi:hypothetical protein